MRPKHLYLALCVLGTVLPYSQLLPFLNEHGPDPRAFVRQMFATPISGFFSWDVVVSSLVLWVLVFAEGRRSGMRHWWTALAANLAVGVSLGLPLYLYQREILRERHGEGRSG
jgi:hypothetical protein